MRDRELFANPGDTLQVIADKCTQYQGEDRVGTPEFHTILEFISIYAHRAIEERDQLRRKLYGVRKFSEALDKAETERDAAVAAAKVFREATFQGHTAHWDKKGTHGANCPACRSADDLRRKGDEMLKRLDAREGG